ncbi:MAG: hypothetical protein COA43_01360 [Robiginitomaculum sp.]|nr:MAG: hypothetical protein COA43_01360 [Robiginitomaculum sp.]
MSIKRRIINKSNVFVWASLPVLAISFLLILTTWYYRDDVFQTIYDPGEPFQTYTPPLAPDYAKSNAWLMRPDLDMDSINIKGGDVFVVTPTVYLGRYHWNAPLENKKFMGRLQRIVLPNYVQPYQSAGRVFAPHYRQASLYSFLNNRDDAQISQKFAYYDVKRAFEVFLQANPLERPITLIGHGQGGLHVQRLLSEYFTGARKQKLAAAYIIDHPFPLDRFNAELTALSPCETKNDINCVIAFGAFQPKEKTRSSMFKGKTLVWNGAKLESVNQRPLLCINPLIWTRSTQYAPAKLHLGGAAAEGLGNVDIVPAPIAKQTSAQCQDGILLIDKPKQKSLRRPSRFGGKFRTPPSNLFYEDIRMDAANRVQLLLDKNILPRRAPLMEMHDIEIRDSPITEPLARMKKPRK